MANWCDNAILFTGEPGAVKAVLEMFREIEQKQAADQEWDFPACVTAENSVVMDVVLGDDKVYYSTRWLPNLEALRQIADYFDVGFINRYEEPANFVYGEANYSAGRMQNIYLDLDDYNQYDWASQTHQQLFEGKIYENEWDLFHAMLDIKIIMNVISPYRQDQGPFNTR